MQLFWVNLIINIVTKQVYMLILFKLCICKNIALEFGNYKIFMYLKPHLDAFTSECFNVLLFITVIYDHYAHLFSIRWCVNSYTSDFNTFIWLFFLTMNFISHINKTYHIHLAGLVV